MKEADAAGIKTPSYIVFRDVTDDNPDSVRGCKHVNAGQWDQRPFYRLTGGWRDDPWNNYRRGDAKALSEDERHNS